MSSPAHPFPASPEALLQQIGLKATAPRLRILALIQASPTRHLSAEEIFRRLHADHARLSLATVYRILSQLEAAGLLRRHLFDDARAVYECNDRERHDHLVCVQCGRVEEFSSPGLDALQEEIAQRHGFLLRTHRLVLYGVCALCRRKHQA